MRPPGAKYNGRLVRLGQPIWLSVQGRKGLRWEDIRAEKEAGVGSHAQIGGSTLHGSSTLMF